MEKRILDEATKKALQGYNPFSPNATVEVTPPEYNFVGVEWQPKFSIRCMTKDEKAEYISIYSNVKKDEKTGEAPDSEWKAIGDKIEKIYLQCLMGWRDLFDSGTGEEIVYIPYTEGGDPQKHWDMLPAWIQVFISGQIKKISHLTPIEKLSLK